MTAPHPRGEFFTLLNSPSRELVACLHALLGYLDPKLPRGFHAWDARLPSEWHALEDAVRELEASWGVPGPTVGPSSPSTATATSPSTPDASSSELENANANATASSLPEQARLKLAVETFCVLTAQLVLFHHAGPSRSCRESPPPDKPLVAFLAFDEETKQLVSPECLDGGYGWWKRLDWAAGPPPDLPASMIIAFTAAFTTHARRVVGGLRGLDDPYQDVVWACFSPELRKNLGEFYTPDPLVQYILTRVEYRAGCIHDSRIVDPCCGAGAFLREAMTRWLAERADDPPRATLERLLVTDPVVGYDVNPLAVALARVQLLDLLHSYWTTREPGDALVELPVTQRDTLREVNPAGSFSFDYVVFNPPYVNAYRLSRRALRARYPDYELLHAGKKVNLGHLFIEWAYRALRAGGRVGFVFTDKWMEWAGPGIREFIARRAVREILCSSVVSFFPDALVHAAVVIVHAAPPEPDDPVHMLALFADPPLPATLPTRSDPSANSPRERPAECPGAPRRDFRTHLARLFAFLENLPAFPAYRRVQVSGNFFLRTQVPWHRYAAWLPRSWAPFKRLLPVEIQVLDVLVDHAPPLHVNPDFLQNSRGNRVMTGITAAGLNVFKVSGDILARDPALAREIQSLLRVRLRGSDLAKGALFPTSRSRTPVLGIHHELAARLRDTGRGVELSPCLGPEKYLIFPYAWDDARERWEHVSTARFPRLKQFLLARLAGSKKPYHEFLRRQLIDHDAAFYLDKDQRGYKERRPPLTLARCLPRLYIRDRARENTFCLDLEGKWFPDQSCCYAILNTPDAQRAYYYFGLLLSEIVEFFVRAVGVMEEGKVFRHRRELLHHVPLVPYSPDAPSHQQVADAARQVRRALTDFRVLLAKFQAFLRDQLNPLLQAPPDEVPDKSKARSPRSRQPWRVPFRFWDQRFTVEVPARASSDAKATVDARLAWFERESTRLHAAHHDATTRLNQLVYRLYDVPPVEQTVLRVVIRRWSP